MKQLRLRVLDFVVGLTIGLVCALIWLLSWPWLVWVRTRRYRRRAS